MLYAHNVRLRQGASFRVSVRWIRGLMVRTRAEAHASFDDPDSFVLEIDKGVVRVGLADIEALLNSGSSRGMPLTGISITADGETLTLHGTLHKIVPMPVELVGSLTPLPDGRVKFSVSKMDVLKIPVSGLLGVFHLQLADMVKAGKTPGLQIAGNDVMFDTEMLLPPPHIRGEMSSLRVVGPEIEVVYGGAGNDESKLSEWHNFLRLSGGTVDFGKLTMRRTDLTMIDASQAEWFDLDLVNYQEQLVNGTTKITPEAGLEVFMPAAGTAKATQAVSIEWLKNRSAPVPADVPVR